jgi:cobalt/nickel transport system ATP-binding protein
MEDNTMDLVEINDITYAYDDGTLALKNITLSINPGEKVALLGPNGAGKSTLLHLLAGLKTAQTGEIKLFGETMNKNTEKCLRRRIGILFQDPDDQIFMPQVWDDIAFGPINLGLEADAVKERVEWALDQAGLKGFEHRVPHHLSYGEKKRVAIAGVLAMKPDILFLDEPTANLDSKGRAELISLIQSLEATILIATHDINAAVHLTNRAYLLNKTIIGSGSLSEIFSNRDYLEKAELEPPEITGLFKELESQGRSFPQLPLTIQDAVTLLIPRLKPEK